jgi:hypothetical protein
MDTEKDFPMRGELFPLVDKRFLILDRNRIRSQSPCVKAAFLLFQPSSLAKAQLEKAYSEGDGSVFGKQVEKFLINYFEVSSNIKLEMKVFKDYKLQDNSVQMEFLPREPRVRIELERDMESLTFSRGEFYTLYVPTQSNFPGIDFALVMKEKKEVYIFQVKSDLNGLS